MNDQRTIIFGLDGEATKNGNLDIAYISYVYGALNSLVNDSNKELGISSEKIVLKEGITKEGSWYTELLTEYPNIKTTLDFCRETYILDILALYNVIGLVKDTVNGVGFLGKKAVGLIEFVLRLRGREVSVTKLDNNFYQVNYDDFNGLVVSRDTLMLYGSKSVRKSLKKLIFVLKSDGIDKVMLKNSFADDKPFSTVLKNEADFFDYDESLEEKSEFIDEHAMLKLKIRCDEGNSKWKFDYKGKPVNVKILHEQWLSDYQLGRFSIPARAVLEARLRITFSKIEDILNPDKTKYAILHVHEVHYENKGQTNLFLESDSSNEFQENTIQ